MYRFPNSSLFAITAVFCEMNNNLYFSVNLFKHFLHLFRLKKNSLIIYFVSQIYVLFRGRPSFFSVCPYWPDGISAPSWLDQGWIPPWLDSRSQDLAPYWLLLLRMIHLEITAVLDLNLILFPNPHFIKLLLYFNAHDCIFDYSVETSYIS